MPHQCTNCQETYGDGSENVLSGCQECGGTTFQYVPQTGPQPSDDLEAATGGDHSSENTPIGGGVISVGGDEPQANEEDDPSQKAARTDVVDTDSLPSTDDLEQTEDVDETYEVDLDALRQELNQQFEGIHIVGQGQYELDLMELYRREECVITLHDDGRYAIGIPGDDGFSLEDA